MWLHAVSVGEVGVAATLARALPSGTPLVVTTITPTGQALAKRAFAQRGDVRYLPFDLGFAVDRFFTRFSPRSVVLVEGDLWPLILETARNRGIPIAVINGRVGDRGYSRLRLIKRLAPSLSTRLYELVDRFGVQSSIDRDRLVELGVPAERIEITGNLKYDAPEPSPPTIASAIERLGNGRPILIAGSTMDGEEVKVLEAFRQAGGGRKAMMVLAPRHPERWNEVARLLEETGFTFARRSQIDAAPASSTDIVLLDSLGDLAGLYRLARGAFIGGTMVPRGGHNPLEPAVFGVPVVVGPSMFNFVEMAERFDRANAWKRAASAQELGETFASWLDKPLEALELGARGRALIEENRGAVARTLTLLEPWIAAVR